MPDRPNILFVFADQMRAQAAGYAGDPNVHTPCMDRLAAESLTFTTAVSNCPVCTPYRACLLTGQYPLRHGLFMNDLCLPDNGHAIAREFRRAGYDTAYIGKWHLDGHGRTRPIPPERRQGFEAWKVLECTHSYNHSQYYDGEDTTPRFWEGYDAYAQTAAAVTYIRARQHGTRPFVLFLSFGTPHDPYDTAPEELKACYPEGALELRDNVPPHRAALARRQLTGYYAHVAAIDRCLAQLDGALAEAGLAENTIFVFTSDHGDMLESHAHDQTAGPLRGPRKQAPYDESILVPLLLRYPGRYGSRGRAVPTPIATPDIMPTLLSLCDVPIPGTVEGIDFTPVIEGAGGTGREGVLIAAYHPFADWRTARGGRPYRGIRTETHTFVRDRNGPWLLFDNRADPYQKTNLVNTAATASVQQCLDAELRRILALQNDPFDPPEVLRQTWKYHVDDQECIPY
ncbi:MAG: sulfatase [Lentisphaeria bacterium]|nr:sulfatase [Lentisphaeria bacterium]